MSEDVANNRWRLTEGDEKGSPQKDNGHTPSLKLDPEKYRGMLDESSWTKEEQNEYLAVLWEIMSSLARMQFGLEPIHSIFQPALSETWREAANDVKVEGQPSGESTKT